MMSLTVKAAMWMFCSDLIVLLIIRTVSLMHIFRLTYNIASIGIIVYLSVFIFIQTCSTDSLI